MTPTLAAVARPGSPRPLLRVTANAARLVEQLRAEAGDVAFFVAPRLSDEVMCVGRRDVTLGPNDLLIGTILGCPLYVDRRDCSSAHLARTVLDVQPGPAGPTFVLRSSGGDPS